MADSFNYPPSFNALQKEQFKSLSKIMRETILNAMEGMSKADSYHYAPSSKTSTKKAAGVQFNKSLANANFKALYESVTSLTYAQALSKRDYLASKLEELINDSNYTIQSEELKEGDTAPIPVKTSDRTAAMKQYSDLFDLANPRFSGGTLDLHGMNTGEQLDSILMALAGGSINSERGRTLMAAIKLKTDVKEQVEMQEKVENIERMLLEARVKGKK